MSLSEENLEETRKLCAQVLKLVNLVDEERREWPATTIGCGESDTLGRSTHPGYTRASAALKRKSLDLTRQLAVLRDPYR